MPSTRRSLNSPFCTYSTCVRLSIDLIKIHRCHPVVERTGWGQVYCACLRWGVGVYIEPGGRRHRQQQFGGGDHEGVCVLDGSRVGAVPSTPLRLHYILIIVWEKSMTKVDDTASATAGWRWTYLLAIYGGYPDLRAPSDRPKHALSPTKRFYLAFSVAGHAELAVLNSRMLLNRVLLNRGTPAVRQCEDSHGIGAACSFSYCCALTLLFRNPLKLSQSSFFFVRYIHWSRKRVTCGVPV